MPIHAQRRFDVKVAATVGSVPRRARKIFDDHRLFHVNTRSAGACLIFLDDVDRLRFADCFWTAVLRYELKCLVACQVGTHYHAVFDTEREALSRAMQKLNGAYARWFNVRHERHGHLFGSRFRSWVIESDRHLGAAIPYVLWNPVRAGLCSTPEEWEWSWLDPALEAEVGPELAAATGRDCPMGQSLRRVRAKHLQALPKKPPEGRRKPRSRAVLRYCEQDAL